MKKVLFSILLLVVFPMLVFAKEDKLVKVYVYEAGGCPYCEAELDYLKGLKSYNKKFKIVKKELYVDHIKWEHGKDYETGVKVANTFRAAGFNDADYRGTPFVVISDIYASTGYSTDLEKVINEAYEKGDKDIVSCIESGKEECISGVTAQDVEAAAQTIGASDDDNAATPSTYSNGTASANTIATTIICSIVIIAVYLIKSTKDKNDILDRLHK